MSAFEKFTMQEMHRSELKKYPLNPRKITAEAKRRLKAGLERFGLVSPLIFNKRSGYLVGGHQRMSVMDDLQGDKDYTLNIAVVDLDESKEKELVVFLNNTSSMGFWDDEALLEIMNGQDTDKNMLGFSATEMDYFDKLMQEADIEETAALNYMDQMTEEAEALENAAAENNENATADKETKKQKWENTISNFFEPAPLQSLTNAKSDEELTPEELAHRKNFRESRENWKKQDGSSEVVVRIVFSSQEKARGWLSSKGLPSTQFLLHEKELD
jgi:hypothetical protein